MSLIYEWNQKAALRGRPTTVDTERRVTRLVSARMWEPEDDDTPPDAA